MLSRILPRRQQESQRAALITANGSLSLDFLSQAYLMNLQSKSFADIFTFSRASTGTRINASGVMETIAANQPRFDYDPVTLQPKGLLIEEQKTNILDRGNAVGQAGGIVPIGWGLDQWFGGVNPLFSNNKTNSFGRSASVWSVVGTTSLMNRLLVSPNTAFPGSSVTPGNSYSFGIDMACSAGYGGGITFSFIWYNASNTILSVSDVPTSGIGQSANRLTGTAVAPANAAALRIRIDFTSMPAIGSNVNFTYEIGAAQIEVGNPSSYIPTNGSQVTRAADFCSINTLSPWYNSAAGTIYAEASVPQIPPGSTFPMVARFSGVSGEAISVGFFTTISALEVASGSVNQAALYPPSAALLRKSAGAYSLNSFGFSVNGSVAFADSSGVVPTVSTMWFGSTGSGLFLNGHIRKIRYFKNRRTDDQLQSLTA